MPVKEDNVEIPPKPSNEKQRLDALYQYEILDTPAEGIFDLITSIATKVCDTPIGLITLIDQNRQWFKSKLGMGGDKEVSRDIAFCSHTILQPELLEVPDAKEDKRFHDNPFVTDDPNIRFYAGMPITNPDGYRLGALCVIDKTPKKLTDKQKEIMQDLSAIVMKLFENKKDINLHLQKLKQIESELQEKTIFNAQILNSALNGIVSFDQNGIIQTANPAVVELFQYQPGELIGQKIHLILPKLKDLSAHHKLYETEGIAKDGTPKMVELFASHLGIEAKNLFVAFIRDVTKFKEVERMKNEFISLTSHELRTPLTAIQGSLRLVLSDSFGLGENPKVTTLLKIALESSDRLLRLINDILDIEKIESGKIQLSLQTLSLEHLLKEAIVANEVFANQFNVQIQLKKVEPGIVVNVDHDRLIQVITNLLSNAIKFSPAGSQVEVAMQKQDQEVTVSIRDHGPGISAEFQKKIFQKFSQDQSTSAKTKGTGLGLTISKSIIEELGGKIGFETKPQQGTTFYFTLPITQNEKPAYKESESTL